MLGVLREMSASKLSAGILLVLYYHARFMAIVSFKVDRQRISVNGHLVMELRARHCPCWLWFCVIYRTVIMGTFAYFYCLWIVRLEDYLERVSHYMRLVIITLVCICIIRLQLLYRTESIELVNTCLRLFRRIRALPKRRTFGYGGCRELVLLLLSLSCRIHEMVYLVGQLGSILIWWCNTFVVFGSSIMMGIAFLGYLSLGLLYSELNDFVRCELRGQLQALERPHGLQPGRQQLRTVRRHLDECLALYREIYCLATSFQQLIEIPFLLTFIHNYILLGTVIYKLTIVGWFDEHKVLLGALTIKVILDLLLVTLSVDGARTQFRVIRRLSLENCHVSDHADWHMMFDIFVTHLNLYEFRMRPLGLFEVSNELVLVFVSTLVTFLIYIIQYEMQSKVAWQ